MSFLTVYIAISRLEEYCDQCVCMSACLCVCLLTCAKNHKSKSHEICCTCCLWPQLSRPLTTVYHVMWCRFCGWCHFSCNECTYSGLVAVTITEQPSAWVIWTNHSRQQMLSFIGMAGSIIKGWNKLSRLLLPRLMFYLYIKRGLLQWPRGVYWMDGRSRAAGTGGKLRPTAVARRP